MGLLLGHRPYLQRCNMLGNQLQDAWKIDGIPNRVQAKTIMRQLYGSQATPQAMWQDMGIEYTLEEALAFSEELNSGELALANKFKDFIINNCQMQPTMQFNVWEEQFEVQCNKFFNRGEKTIKYDFYNSYSKSIKRIHHTDTIKVPDLHSFRRFTVTAPIHNLDSRAEDITCDVVYDEFKWVLSVHDATIVDCEGADLTRSTYANQLELVYKDRNNILQEYFRSINIPASAIAEWKREVAPLIEPLKEDFKCSPLVLK